MRSKTIFVVVIILLSVANIASATIDTFGTGDNQFAIEFVPISGDASSANGTNISYSSPGQRNYTTFTDLDNDYRMGTYEISNDQWSKFTNTYGTLTGSPSIAYDASAYWTDTDMPANRVSWYEIAQFVNWLNTSTGHQAAYKFTGTQGTGGYTLAVWESDDTGYDSDNPFRNSNAYYFLPTENEWVKAAYWNGTSLQTYATKAGETLHQGDDVSGTGWNYCTLYGEWATDYYGPWDVGSGSEELNGTYDMMGNVFEWLEDPWNSGDYAFDSDRNIRGGSYDDLEHYGSLPHRGHGGPYGQGKTIGFRVASVPEPGTVLLLGLGALVLRKRKLEPSR